MKWIEEKKLPLGQWIESLINWINENAQGLIEAVSNVLKIMIEGLISILQTCPPLLFIAIFASVAFALHRSLMLSGFVLLAFTLILNLGYWEPTMETLALVMFSAGVCLAIGVPLGIASAHRPRLHGALRPVLDLMQTIPTFVYLIPTLILFGLGVVPGLISTVIFALPAPIRLTRLGIASVPSELKEAGEAFGATRRQLLLKIELPYALPSIMAGITQCIMLSLSMVVIAALVGAKGLGEPVVSALSKVDIGTGFEAGLTIVLLAIVLDRMFRRGSGNPSEGEAR